MELKYLETSIEIYLVLRLPLDFLLLEIRILHIFEILKLHVTS